MPRCLTLAFVLSALQFLTAQVVAAEKYALLIGVTKYEHSGMSELKYPEDDAKALGELLESGGYKVELLLGKDATQKAIRDQLEALRKKGTAEGVIVLGLFGHGVEVETVDGNVVAKDGCFCPFDTDIRFAKDPKGKDLYGSDKQKLTEPDPGTLVKLSEVMSMFQVAKSGHRVLLADCCRVVPNAARDRTFGSSFKASDLPENTSVLFGCSPKEKAFEHDSWEHGAFTRSLLDQIPLMASQGRVTTGTLADRVAEQVPQLVKLVSPRETQTPIPFGTNSVDLQLVLKKELEKLTTNTLGMKLTLIPSGEFLMGSPASEKDRGEDEGPQHWVRITKPFYLGVHEVTKGQFAAFVKSTGYQTDAEKDGKGGYGFADEKFDQKPEYTWKNTGFSQTDTHPVVNVSWNDAVTFCEWLSVKEGKRYQLPSEAEWEYACRSGSTSLWWHGVDAEGLAKVGNVADGTAKEKFNDYPMISARDGYVFTSPVGRYRANGFGLFDMHGNVKEWCRDGYAEGEYATRTGVTNDPLNTHTVDSRVLRGGSWYSSASNTRSAFRVGSSPDDRDDNAGFRVSRGQ